MKVKHINFEELILFQDDDLVAINKPIGYTSLEERYEPGSGLLEKAKKIFPDIKICHRLDKYTTGILLFAKNPESYRHVSMQFQNRQAKKVYKTLIKSARHFENQEVNAPLSPIVKGIVRIDYAHGKKATTVFHSEKIFKHHTYLSCMPITGRSHQIRVHLAYLKCPMVGDLLYGGENLYLSEFKKRYKLSGDQDEYPLNDNYMLHSECLSILHPRTESPISFTAPLPKNLRVSLDLLEKYDL